MSSKTEDQLDELKLKDEAQPTSEQGSRGGDPESSDDEDSSSDEFVALTPGTTSVAWSVIDDADFDIEGDNEEEGPIRRDDGIDTETFVSSTNLNDEQKERLRGIIDARKERLALLETWQSRERLVQYLQELKDGQHPAGTESGSTSRKGLFGLGKDDEDAQSIASSESDPLESNILGDYNAEGQGPGADQDSSFDMEKLTSKTLQLSLAEPDPSPFPESTRQKPKGPSQRIVSWLRYNQNRDHQTKTNEHQSEILAKLTDPSVSRSSRRKLLSGRFLKIGRQPLSKVVKGLEHSEDSENESVLTVILRRDWHLDNTNKSKASSDDYDIWVDDWLAKALITKVITDVSGRRGEITAKGIETQFIDSLFSLHTSGYTQQGLDEYVASQPENPFDPTKQQWWLIDITATPDKARSKKSGRGSLSSTRRIAFKV